MLCPRTHLIEYANRHRLSSKELARGLCFQASLDLAKEATVIGVGHETEMVRWRIRGDPDFVEHWALLLKDGTVLDLTVAQIELNASPVRRLDAYPRNFGLARRYPVDLLLNFLQSFQSAHQSRYSRSLLLRLHVRMFRHDVARALKNRSVRDIFCAFANLLDDAIMLLLGFFLEKAIERMSKLLRKVG